MVLIVFIFYSTYLINNFIEVLFTHHTIHQSTLYNSVVFIIITEVYNYHHNQFWSLHLHHPKRNSISDSRYSPFSPPLSLCIDLTIQDLSHTVDAISTPSVAGLESGLVHQNVASSIQIRAHTQIAGSISHYGVIPKQPIDVSPFLSR